MVKQRCNGICFIGRKETWMHWFGFCSGSVFSNICPLFSYSHPHQSFSTNVAFGNVLIRTLFCCCGIMRNISILKYLNVLVVLCSCILASHSSDLQQHMFCTTQQPEWFPALIACIYIWRIHMENTCVLSHPAPTLGWSVSPSFSHFFFSHTSCHTRERYTWTLVSIHPCDQTADGWIRYQSSHLFWKLGV